MSHFEMMSTAAAFLSVGINLVLFVVFSLQLSALRRQVRESRIATELDHDRRKKQATIEFWSTTLERRLALAGDLPLDRDTSRIEQMLRRIGQEDSEQTRAVANFLGLYEDLATGVNTEVFDLAIIARTSGPRIVSVVENYGEWIRDRRDKRADPFLYAELELLAHRIVSFSATGGIPDYDAEIDALGTTIRGGDRRPPSDEKH